MSAVDVESLRHDYGKHAALRDVTFSVPAGCVFGFLGPNGGGKTTLFRLLSTSLAIQSGSVRVLGLDVAREAAAVRRKIGVVFQSPAVDGKLTVAENLRHHGHLYGQRGAALRTRIEDVLARFELRGRAGDLVETLSGGLRRRVEIAKAILHRPEALLLDEPSTGLDPAARRVLRDELRALGVTVLLTTHLLDEADRCDRIAILHEGRIVAEGAPEALKSSIGGDVVSVATREPEELAAAVRAKFGVEPRVVDGTVHVERERGHEFVPALVEAFPGRIDSVTVGKPTLEDVFIRKTGRKLE